MHVLIQLKRCKPKRLIIIIMATCMVPVNIMAEFLTGDTQTRYFKQNNDDAFLDIQSNINYTTQLVDMHLLFQYQNDDPPGNFFTPVYDSDQFSGKINVKLNDNTVTVGHFYDSIGHGIVLRAQKDDAVLVDQNIYGFRWSGSHSFMDYKLFRGDVRHDNGIRSATTSGIQTMGYLTDAVGVGIGVSSTRLSDSNHDGRALLISVDNHAFQLNGEVAQSGQSGYGNYLNADISFNQWVHHIEYAKYSNMQVTSHGLELSQGPMALHESICSLPNQFLPTVTMGYHEAHTLQTSYHSLNDWILEVSFSEETSGTYKETAISYETESIYLISKPKIGYSNQAIGGSNYHTWMIKSNVPSLWNQSIDIRNEYQSREATQYFTYLSEVTLLVNQSFSIGYLYEEARQFSYHKNWQALLVSYQAKQNHFVQLYIGQIAGGLVCSGGVCIMQPEFNGIKMNWTYNF